MIVKQAKSLYFILFVILTMLTIKNKLNSKSNMSVNTKDFKIRY